MSLEIHLTILKVSVMLPLIIYLGGSLVQVHNWNDSGLEKLKFSFILGVGITIAAYLMILGIIDIIQYVK